MAVKEVKNYNPVARALHWLSAIVVIGMFAVGLWMVDLTYYSQWYKTAPDWHRSVGILLAMVTVFRLVWKHVTVAPQVEGNQFEKVGAKLVTLRCTLPCLSFSPVATLSLPQMVAVLTYLIGLPCRVWVNYSRINQTLRAKCISMLLGSSYLPLLVMR